MQKGTPKATERLELDFQSIPQPSAVNMVLNNPSDAFRAVQYIRINYFSSEGTRQVAQAITEGEVLGIDGYIIDLRNNPGQ